MTTKSFWFPVFRKFIPADFEAWMEKLAYDGWNIDKIDMFSVLRFTFHKAEPKQYRYVFDMKFNTYKHKDYRKTYEQFGWEFVGRFNANTFLWRREYTAERPESFTDRESLIQRNKRVRNAMIGAFVLSLAAILALITGIVLCAVYDKMNKILPLTFVALLVTPLSVYLYWAIRKVNADHS